jgi:hypothetical protein
MCGCGWGKGGGEIEAPGLKSARGLQFQLRVITRLGVLEGWILGRVRRGEQ